MAARLPYNTNCMHYALCIRDSSYTIAHALSLELQALMKDAALNPRMSYTLPCAGEKEVWDAEVHKRGGFEGVEKSRNGLTESLSGLILRRKAATGIFSKSGIDTSRYARERGMAQGKRRVLSAGGEGKMLRRIWMQLEWRRKRKASQVHKVLPACLFLQPSSALSK